MNRSEIRWNDEAREKILSDSDKLLRDTVLELADSMTGEDSDAIFAELNGRLKVHFIDYETGPDIRKYADAIAAHELSVTE